MANWLIASFHSFTARPQSAVMFRHASQISLFAASSLWKWPRPLLDAGIRISMDGRGACRDNVFVERLWRSVKYEEVYLRAYDTVAEARAGIARNLAFYNEQRPHSRLDGQKPNHAYFGGASPMRLAAWSPRGCGCDRTPACVWGCRPVAPAAAHQRIESTHADNPLDGSRTLSN
jgi:putative transposase